MPPRHPLYQALRVLGALGATVGVGAVLVACGGGASTDRESTLLNAGLKAQADHRLAQADADYLAVLKLDGSNRTAWYDLGVIAQQQGYADDARHDYRQALVVDPHYVPALYNLGTLEAVTSPTMAVRLYRQVVKLTPGDAAAHYNLGLALKSLGHAKEGTAEIAKAVTLDPSLARSPAKGSGAKG
jgi:tetratricopeptide (TPR) repeat protein